MPCLQTSDRHKSGQVHQRAKNGPGPPPSLVNHGRHCPDWQAGRIYASQFIQRGFHQRNRDPSNLLEGTAQPCSLVSPQSKLPQLRRPGSWNSFPNRSMPRVAADERYQRPTYPSCHHQPASANLLYLTCSELTVLYPYKDSGEGAQRYEAQASGLLLLPY